jgi:protein subunit release factor B
MSSVSDFQTKKTQRLARLKLAAGDFEEHFSRSSGPGGQHVNKVSTAVSVKYLPTGRIVTAQDSRSQAMNRQLAWDRMFDGIEEERRQARLAVRAAASKLRGQKALRPWGVQQRVLENKRRRGDVKRSRGRCND